MHHGKTKPKSCNISQGLSLSEKLGRRPRVGFSSSLLNFVLHKKVFCHSGSLLVSSFCVQFTSITTTIILFMELALIKHGHCIVVSSLLLSVKKIGKVPDFAPTPFGQGGGGQILPNLSFETRFGILSLRRGY